MSQKSIKITTERTEIKDSYQSRCDCAEVVGTNGPKSEIWKANTVIQDLGQKLVTAGTALKSANATVNAIESQLAQARGTRETRAHEFDTNYELYATNVEAVAKTPEDVAGLGLPVRPRLSHPLSPPLEVNPRFDAKKNHIRVHIKRAPGMQVCLVEISTNPEDPTSWQRLPSVGAVHVLTGYAPGTYWIRAASARANEQSRFTDPVSVIVK